MHLREPHGRDTLPADFREQLSQAAATIFDQGLKRQYVDGRSALQIKKVGLDVLVRGHGESRDAILVRGKRLDRAFPARLRIILSKQSVGGKIVNRGWDHESAIRLGGSWTAV